MLSAFIFGLFISRLIVFARNTLPFFWAVCHSITAFFGKNSEINGAGQDDDAGNDSDRENDSDANDDGDNDNLSRNRAPIARQSRARAVDTEIVTHTNLLYAAYRFVIEFDSIRRNKGGFPEAFNAAMRLLGPAMRKSSATLGIDNANLHKNALATLR